MISNKLLNLSNRLFKNVKANNYKHYPNQDFDTKHLDGAKLLRNRIELLELLPKGKVVSEIGVNKGDFTQQIIDICQPKKIIIIDFWGSKRYNKEIELGFRKRFEKLLDDGTMEIHLGLSNDMIPKFEKEYFDWVYLDTAHTYDVTKEELFNLNSKIKKNGIIAGHDYITGNWNGGVRYGVIEAVREFCILKQWKLIYQTTELKINPSFAIQRL